MARGKIVDHQCIVVKDMKRSFRSRSNISSRHSRYIGMALQFLMHQNGDAAKLAPVHRPAGSMFST